MIMARHMADLTWEHGGCSKPPGATSISTLSSPSIHFRRPVTELRGNDIVKRLYLGGVA
jgi:hypothetical protein